MHIKVGSSRIVFVFKNVVVKVPKFWRLSRFGLGIVENLQERHWYCSDNTVHKMDVDLYPLAPIHYASQNGLIVVMQRATVITEALYESSHEISRRRLDNELAKLQEWAKGLNFRHDVRWDNVGWIGDKFVIVDYGYVCRTQFYDDSPLWRTGILHGTKIVAPTIWGRLWLLRRNIRNFFKGVKP